MKPQPLPLLLLSLLILSVQGVTLEGQWHVSSIANRQVDLTLTITEIVYRETSVIYKMEWLGCRSILYQMDTQDDNMWIDVGSQWEQEKTMCSDDQSQQMELVKLYVPGTLKFRISRKNLMPKNWKK